MISRYITKRPRSTFWQLLVPVPKDLQEAFGPKEFTRSIGERDSTYNPDGITLSRKAEIIALIEYPEGLVPHPMN